MRFNLGMMCRALVVAAIVATVAGWVGYATKGVANELMRPVAWAMTPHTLDAFKVDVNRSAKADRLHINKQASRPTFYNGPACSFLSDCSIVQL